MTSTREQNYICTPYFCRRNVVGLYSQSDFSDSPLIIPADHFDLFAVIMSEVISDYTLFDDRELSFEQWCNFLCISSEYLSLDDYSKLLAAAGGQLYDWLRINGEIFRQELDSYRIILAEMLVWTEQNVTDCGVKVMGI